MISKDTPCVEKHETCIPGFDHVAQGGLPIGRTTLVLGTAGSAKTVFAAQYLAAGILQCGEPGVFVTFEEKPSDIRLNMLGFGWNIEEWEAEGLFAFVDGSPEPSQDDIEAGLYDLGALLARIEHSIRRTKAKRVAVDSLGAIFTQFTDSATVRREIYRISSVLKSMKTTALMTAERTENEGDLTRYGVEEFVADNVVILRNSLDDEKRRRTLEILKFRGTTHHLGEYPFSVAPNGGVVVIPMSAIQLEQRSSNLRVSSGIPELDEMCGGGFFRDSVILLSGATGTGKTLTVTHFIGGGAASGDRCLLFAFEESREQLFRNATGWGIDAQKMEVEGQLKVVCRYPESANLEDHLIFMKQIIDDFQPTRVAVDSLSALERVSSPKGFREFIITMTSFIKHHEITGLFTATTPTLMGGESVTEAHISTLTDSIILLRYVEMFGEVRRGITVLKMRGSKHRKDILEFAIDGQGMHIGRPFRQVIGIISGKPSYIAQSEAEQMSRLFPE